MRTKSKNLECCALCGCRVHHKAGTYAKPNVEGRSHATQHHYVAERFFGRSANRRGTVREPIFRECPWSAEGQTQIFCYECHEEVLHNPVFLKSDIENFAKLVNKRGLAEDQKTESRDKVGGRIRLLHEIIRAGLAAVAAERSPGCPARPLLQGPNRPIMPS